MTEIILSVWLMLTTSGGRTYVSSTHLTESACKQAAAERIESRYASGAFCAEGVRSYSVSPPKEPAMSDTYRTTAAKIGTCTGDDRFCMRK